jgi:hypothetical protein
MLVSAGLALMSALAAALLVGDWRARSTSRDPLRRTVAARKAPVLRAALREEGATREGRDPQPVTVNAT